MKNYHIIEEQAKGKYSVIFKARKKKKLQFVAIKRIDKSRQQKVINESRILSLLKHTNVILFHQYMQTKNHTWAVTEYCPGGDLMKLIEQDKMLPENTARGFALEIMHGLQYVHSKGVVMHDIKPASILINQYGHVKIGDFGAAQKLEDIEQCQLQKKKGTPCYMAPELFEVRGVYSFASDIWALGCILYEMGQGNPPFVSISFQEIATLAQSCDTPRIDSFSAQFNDLIGRLLAKDPAQRATWNQIRLHSWVQGQLPVLIIPVAPHFQQYKKVKKLNSKPQFLRASQQLNGYGKDKHLLASNRREQFIFDIDAISKELNDLTCKIYFEKQQEQLPSNSPAVQTYHHRAEANELQDSTTINLFLQALSSKNLPAIDDILDHQSDNNVKPIIGNKQIEPIESFSFNKKALGFPFVQSQVLAQGILNGQMQNQLSRILQGMTGDQKYNVMGYFQSIIQNSQIANYLFKSTYISFYVKLMKSYKQPSLRAKMCEILGLLIRHATSIDPDILKYGIVNGFLEALKDKSEKVRRKAMAALGELLFYGATQVDESVSAWDLSINIIHTLLKVLKNNTEDEIVRLYCCKSIQNITAQAKEVGVKFAQLDTLIVLISCFTSSKHQGFKGSVVCCLHHIMVLNPSLRELFIDKVGLTSIIDTFNNPQSSNKTQQILLWILLLQLGKSYKSKISRILLEDQVLLQAILRLLEINSSVIRGRVYLFIYYVLNHNLCKAVLLLDSKLFHIIERQGKDGSKYETQCLQFVLIALYENYLGIIVHTDQQIQRSLNGSDIIRKSNILILLQQILCNPIFQQLFSNYKNIQQFINLLQYFDKNQPTKQSQLLKSHYMQILTYITNTTSITEKLQQHYTDHLLPILISKIINSAYKDIRFSCTNALLCLVSVYLAEQTTYDSTILTMTAQRVTKLINEQLIPQLDSLLMQDETVASMTLKLVAVLFRTNKIFITRYCQCCKIDSLLLYYTEHSSVNILKIVQQLISCQQLPTTKQILFLTNSLSLLKQFTDDGHQIYLEYPLDILKTLIVFCQQDAIDFIWDIVVELQVHEDVVIREKAENLIEASLKCGKVSKRGRWELKNKKCMNNYEKYSRIVAQQAENNTDNVFKKTAHNSRYK